MQDTPREKRFPLTVMVVCVLIGLAIIWYSFETLEKKPQNQQPNLSVTNKSVTLTNKTSEGEIATNLFVNNDFSSNLNETTVSKTNEVPHDVLEKIQLFLDAWASSWEQTAGPQGKHEKFFSFYSLDFQANNFQFDESQSKAAWEQDKISKNSKKDWINISLSEVNISSIENLEIFKVFFVLNYRSSNYSDISEKELVLLRTGKDFKILSEKLVGMR